MALGRSHASRPDAPGFHRRAAQYVRMSTEHQQYSTENQADAIARYAERHGLQIVRTYADEGKSGLNLEGRAALQQLIADVTGGRADFDVVLVYDISRWGRFQDADQSAYYEVVCRNAGVTVEYCAEQFANDGSIGSTIIKTVKRAMAGEYSRELSSKVFAGQCRLIGYGFRQGGPAGFGLRRVLVDHLRQAKGELARGEHKSIQTDRVVLAPGPEAEVEIVRRMYRMFTLKEQSEREIAAELNAEGLLTDLGRPWTRGTVHQVLTNEKYIGNNVFNRTSFKLKVQRVRNPPEEWIRADSVFEPIVELDFFAAAQRIIQDRSKRYSDEALLERLAALFSEKGYLSGLVIDEADDMPSSSAYRHRFGSLVRAYQLIGFSPARDYRFIEINRALRAMHAEAVDQTVRGIEDAGGQVVVDQETDLLRINQEFTASIVIARCFERPSGALRWKIRLDAGLRPDISIAVRMDRGNATTLDYYLLPRIDLGQLANLRMAEANGVLLDTYRFDNLEALFYLSRRHELRTAA
jgi:DNA invertase Pin-like site-specific DNA recombinase